MSHIPKLESNFFKFEMNDFQTFLTYFIISRASEECENKLEIEEYNLTDTQIERKRKNKKRLRSKQNCRWAQIQAKSNQPAVRK